MTCLITNYWLDTKMGGEGSGVDQEEAGKEVDVIETHCSQFSKS